MKKTLVALAVALLVQSAWAQEGPPTDSAPRPAAKLDRVEINSRPQSDSDLRRKSQVAKQIYGREELDKFGDTNVADVLKRLPGVTMQGSAPRMRGLGSGYTLILINGDPAPPGFDLSQLDPAQVERIEITKGPTADQSAQAVAGAINIILKDPPKVRQRDLRMSMSYNAARPTPAATFTYGERKGGLSYSIPVSAFEWRGENDSVTTREMPGTDSTPTVPTRAQATQATRSDFWGHGLNSTPRVNWKISDDESLNLLGFLQKGRWHTRSTNTNTDVDPNASLDADSLSLGTFQMMRGNVQYQNRFSDSQRIELKASIQDVRATFNNDTSAVDTVTPVLPERVSFGNNKDRSYTQSGKYAQLLGDEHSLAVGWELESRRRDELRTVLINGVEQLPGVDGLPFAARIQRQALYVQDEWEISPQWSAYLGLRSERISTESVSGGDADPRNVSRVTTPLLHVNYKLDPKGRDLIRASLTRSYKAPDLGALLARPALSSLHPDPTTYNDATSPDRIGNPGLKPELATGLDVAYEKYLSGGGLISIGGFYRSVSNLIRNITDLETVDYSPVQRYVSHPVNFSKAQTAGLEFEIKGRAGEVLPSLFDPKLPLNLRASLSYYHSRVEALPGPNNRLDGQQPWSGNMGFDYRLTSLPLNMGASLVYTPGYTTTQTTTQSLEQSRSRGLDMFAQWSFSRVTSMRLAVNNLTPVDTQANTQVGDGFGTQTTRKGRTFFNLGFDTKF